MPTLSFPADQTLSLKLWHAGRLGWQPWAAQGVSQLLPARQEAWRCAWGRTGDDCNCTHDGPAVHAAVQRGRPSGAYRHPLPLSCGCHFCHLQIHRRPRAHLQGKGLTASTLPDVDQSPHTRCCSVALASPTPSNSRMGGQGVYPPVGAGQS